jgi:Protein of unknown function (DUF3047)
LHWRKLAPIRSAEIDLQGFQHQDGVRVKAMLMRRLAARCLVVGVVVSALGGCASTQGPVPAAAVPVPVLAAVPATLTGGSSIIVSPIGEAADPHPSWQLALLPRQTKPITQFSVVELEGRRVLRVAASRSYGKLLHPVPAGQGAASMRPRYLNWEWRVDQSPQAADLRQRSGDDVALRVCAFFDWPHERMPMVDRSKLLAAEVIAGQELPTAALCYVWDANLPRGTVMPNAFTRRLRMIVVDGDAGEWHEHKRDLYTDFRAAFADEWREGDPLPSVSAVVIGSDTDNTAGEGLGFLRAISLRR